MNYPPVYPISYSSFFKNSFFSDVSFQKDEFALNQLPLEMIYEIFKHLDAYSIARFSLTSHFFADQSQTEGTWKHLVNHDFNIAYSHLTAVIEGLPSDKKISTIWFKLYGLLAKGSESWRKTLPSYPLQYFQSLATLTNDYFLGGGLEQLYIWSTSSINEKTLERHIGRITCLAGIADDQLVTGSDDGTVRIWSLLDKKHYILGSHEKAVNSLVLLPDNQIATASVDSTVRIWSLNDFSSYILEQAERPIYYLTVLPNNRLATACAGTSEVSIWPLDSKERITLHLLDISLLLEIIADPKKLSLIRITSLTTLVDGRLVIGTRAGRLYIYALDMQTFELLMDDTSDITCMTPLCDGRLVTGSSKGKLHLWSLKGNANLSWQAHKSGIVAITSFPDGRIVSHAAGKTSIWSIDGEALCKKVNKKRNLPHQTLKKRKLKR